MQIRHIFIPDGRHSAVALLLKAALIQVSDYRLLGASGLMEVSRFYWNISFDIFVPVKRYFSVKSMFLAILKKLYIQVLLFFIAHHYIINSKTFSF